VNPVPELASGLVRFSFTPFSKVVSNTDKS